MQLPENRSSGGQRAPRPLQNSGGSQDTPSEGRHGTLVLSSTSGGHAALVPVHISATSHVVPSALTCAGRQTVDALANALGGQVLLLPSQTESS